MVFLTAYLIPNEGNTAVNISIEDQCAVGPDESGVDGEERSCVGIIVDLVSTDVPATDPAHRSHVDSFPHLPQFEPRANVMGR